jgi:hypothetical protein
MVNLPRAVRPRSLGPLVVLSALLVAACTTGASGPSASGTAPPSNGAESPSPAASSRQVPIPSPSGPLASGAVPVAVVNAAIADAATVSGVDPSAITVVSAEPKTWNDGSLGCPQPGQLYTQALVPGYQVILDANGKKMDYRATASGDVKLCENPKAGG